MPGPQLPSARSFLTDLFSSLPAATGHDKNDSGTTSSSILNPLKDLQPGAQRNIFLTLHVLFPNELLPALNLLDRRLVTRVIIIPPGTSPPTSGPRQREAGPAAVARGAAETAQQDKDERAAQEKTSQAASRHGPGRRQAAHHHSRDLDGNNLLSSLNNSDARNGATDKNSTATAATGSIAVTGRSAAEQQPGVDAATAPAASITGHGGLLSTARSEDDDATAAAARCHAAGQPETEAAGHSNSGAITSMRPGDDAAAAAGARDLTRTTRNEDGEQTTQFQLPVASGGLAVAPSSPRRSTAERRRADASAYCDNHDDERERRAGNVESQSRNSLHHHHQGSHQGPNQDPTVILDPQPCRPPSPSPQDVQESNLEQGRAQDDQDSPPSHHVVFYVRSASSSTHSSYHSPPPVYEVRLSAWHCTCPAFAFAAFPASSASASPSAAAAGSDLGAGAELSLPNHSSPRSSTSGCDWSFGGLLRERGAEAVPPVCKHLLACLLVERAPRLFGVDADAPADGGLVVQRRFSVLEAAGWAAGWGGL